MTDDITASDGHTITRQNRVRGRVRVRVRVRVIQCLGLLQKGGGERCDEEPYIKHLFHFQEKHGMGPT